MRIEYAGHVALPFEHRMVVALQDMLREQDHMCGVYEAAHGDTDPVVIADISYHQRHIPALAVKIFDALDAGEIRQDPMLRSLCDWMEASHHRVERIFDIEAQRRARQATEAFARLNMQDRFDR